MRSDAFTGSFHPRPHLQVLLPKLIDIDDRLPGSLLLCLPQLKDIACHIRLKLPDLLLHLFDDRLCDHVREHLLLRSKLLLLKDLQEMSMYGCLILLLIGECLRQCLDGCLDPGHVAAGFLPEAACLGDRIQDRFRTVLGSPERRLGASPVCELQLLKRFQGSRRSRGSSFVLLFLICQRKLLFSKLL